MVDEVELTKRIEAYRKMREQALAQANACEGAIQALSDLLAALKNGAPALAATQLDDSACAEQP